MLRYIKDKAVQLLKSALGFHEYGNNGNPYSKWQYGVEYPGGGWCCSFASWVSYMAGFRFGSGAQHGDKGFASTNVAEPWARQQGLWRDRNWRAQPGDWVIFNWDGGGTDHVEVVVYDDGEWLTTIGGNTGNAVAWRKRDRHFVSGFLALSASSQAKPVLTPEAIEAIKELGRWRKNIKEDPLRRGDTRWEVGTLHQIAVNAGLLATIPRKGNTFGLGTANFVAWLKRTANAKANRENKPEPFPTTGGNNAGVQVVDELLSRSA